MTLDRTLQKEIRKKSIQQLDAHGLSMRIELPLLDVDDLRTPEDVGQRIVALYAVTGIANGADRELLRNWLLETEAWQWLTDKERIYFSEPSISEEELNEASWCQESLAILAWAANLSGDLGWPSSEASLTSVFSRIPPEVDVSKFVGSVVLIDRDKVMQALDTYYCLSYFIRHPELVDSESEIGTPSIVLERRQALEWLSSPDTSWDEISLDT